MMQFHSWLIIPKAVHYWQIKITLGDTLIV